MTIEYISSSDLASTLRTSGAIEQWLGHQDENGYRALDWVRIDNDQNGQIVVTKFKIFDDGNHDFLDIYEFEPIDPDNPFGVTREFDTIEDALQFASSEWKAYRSRYVKKGEIQLIYSDFLRKFGLPH